jgi:ribosomal protein L11 methyltransferase
MEYIEISVRIEPVKEEHKEILSAVFGEAGFESFMETEEGFKAYILERDFHKGMIEQVNKLDFPFSFRIEIDIIPEQNWNEIWEKNYFKPIQIGNECVVRASFHDKFPNARYEIVIDPKTAFGTGNHGTTYLLLEEILRLDFTDKLVLDMGCGTGILAILCRMKGASHVLAVDNDPRACANAAENIAFNAVEDITIVEGTTAILKDEQFDVIFENIWKNNVIADIPTLSKHIKTGGYLVVSGFYVEDAPDVIREAEQNGFIFEKTEVKDNWVIVCLTKKVITR